ncbi:TPA: AI-2E family transporter, partial [Listeria monocytogenes]|nr:AI-2E family transporter [Listeria monocytogenes]
MKFSRFRDSKLFFWTIEILAVVAILFVLLQMKYIFSPIGIIVSTLFMPILVAGFLFYLFNPLVLFLEKRKVPRLLSVIVIFIAFITLVVLAVMQLGPTLADQVAELAKAIPGYWQDFEKWLQGLSNNSALKDIDMKQELEKLNISLPKIMSVVVDEVASSFGAIVSFVSSFV